MFSSENYYIIYIIFTGLLITIKCLSGTTLKRSQNKSMKATWILAILFILFFGLRPHTGYDMKDTIGYVATYEAIRTGIYPPFYGIGSINGLNWNAELGWGLLRYIMAINNYDATFWLLINAAIYIFPLVIAIRRLCPGYEYITFIFFIVGFGFYTGGINIIRNGEACSLAFLGISYIITPKKNYPLAIIFFLLSYSFHHSILITISAFIISLFIIRNIKISIFIWIFAIILALVYGNTIANYAISYGLDDRAEHYLERGLNLEQMAHDFS